MDNIMQHGARGLNKKTMRWQVIDKSAEYEVKKSDNSGLYFLTSNKNLLKIAEEKNLIT